MQETTISIDVGNIVAALAPTLAIIAAARIQNRQTKKIERGVSAVHVLVNDQLTREKESKLVLLKSNRLLTKELKGEGVDELLWDLDNQIKELEKEIEKRDETAATLLPDHSKGKGI